MTESLAARFFALFVPGETGHGIYTLIGDGIREDCNVQGKLDRAHREFEPEEVTEVLWQMHLDGKQGLGLVPIRKDGNVNWGAIDVDDYTINHPEVAMKIQTLDLPLIPCRTKSGGLHCYIFTSEPVSAFAMQTKLRDIAAMIGYGKAEVFPKQTKLAEGDQGSWINMPYFAVENTTRYALRPDGEPLTAEQFLELAADKSVKADFFRAAASPTAKTGKAEDTFVDGPPCLNHLATLGFPPGTRDNGLLNIGLYYQKCMPTGWQDAVEKANRTVIGEPLTSGEVTKIIRSLERKKYNYQCNTHPLAPYCNAVKCRMRKFGVSGGEGTTFPIFGEMRKYLTDPPAYFWDMTIDGKTITVELSGSEIQDPRAVKKKIWEAFDIAIPVVKQATWDNTLNEIRRDNFQVVVAPKDASPEGQVWELIERFCTHNPTDVKAELLMGRPYINEKRVFFRMSDLMRYLASQNFKDWKVHQLAKLLHLSKNSTHDQWKINNVVINIWSLPEFARQTSGFEVPDSVSESPF